MTRPASLDRWPDTGSGDTYLPQKPYPNGVTIWRSSRWLGNGFGTQVRYVAVNSDGYIVGRYVNERYRVSSWVLGVTDLEPEYDGPPDHRHTLTSRFVKWRRAVRAVAVPDATEDAQGQRGSA